ncbi:DUF3347 domain-containing protein [bacterium]|nr:DUF3347 domain-containing protein [bacterium]
MKKVKLTSLMLIVFGLSISLTACGGSSSNDHNSEEDDSHNSMENNHAETAHTETATGESTAASMVVNHYLAVKNALVEDNKDGASKAANELGTSLNDLSKEDLSETERKEMSELIEVIKEHGEHIAKSEMDHQREHFPMLSKDISDFIEMTGFDQTIYIQYCPMFDGGKGGSWLSLSEDIKNPLFGSKMLKCGTIKETIEAS